jgi:hypothetical protein
LAASQAAVTGVHHAVDRTQIFFTLTTPGLASFFQDFFFGAVSLRQSKARARFG